MPPGRWLGVCFNHGGVKQFLQNLWSKRHAFRTSLLLEVAAYVSQVAVFFLVAILMSNLLQDEKTLAEIINCRVGPGFWREIVCTFFASLAWLGALSVTSACLPSKAWTQIIRETLNELPRTIYFFGSSVSGLMLAAAVAEWFHPALRHLAYRFSGVALSWALVLFAYGFVLKLMLQASENKALEGGPSGQKEQASNLLP